jgi:hypothetical protein
MKTTPALCADELVLRENLANFRPGSEQAREFQIIGTSGTVTGRGVPSGLEAV